MFVEISSLNTGMRQKRQATSVSTEELIHLLKEAIALQLPNTLEGSVESTMSYFDMIQQFDFHF